MTRKLFVFGTILLGLWVLISVPAYLVAGASGIRGTAVAAAACGVPALGTLAFSLWASRKSTEWQLTALVGGMLVRMGIALGIGMTAHHKVAEFTFRNFLVWLVVYYLASLLVEVSMVARVVTKNEP